MFGQQLSRHSLNTTSGPHPPKYSFLINLHLLLIQYDMRIYLYMRNGDTMRIQLARMIHTYMWELPIKRVNQILIFKNLEKVKFSLFASQFSNSNKVHSRRTLSSSFDIIYGRCGDHPYVGAPQKASVHLWLPGDTRR